MNFFSYFEMSFLLQVTNYYTRTDGLYNWAVRCSSDSSMTGIASVSLLLDWRPIPSFKPQPQLLNSYLLLQIDWEGLIGLIGVYSFSIYIEPSFLISAGTIILHSCVWWSHFYLSRFTFYTIRFLNTMVDINCAIVAVAFWYRMHSSFYLVQAAFAVGHYSCRISVKGSIKCYYHYSSLLPPFLRIEAIISYFHKKYMS